MFYYTLIIGLILDFISKYYAVIFLQKQVNIIGDFLYLRQVYNPGIAFGIEVPFTILKIGTIGLIIGIFYYYMLELKGEKLKKQQGAFSPLSTKYLDLGFGLILSGAIGNAYGRVFNEKVIDFIGVKYFSIFNIADSLITIGAIILIYYYYKTGVSDQGK